MPGSTSGPGALELAPAGRSSGQACSLAQQPEPTPWAVLTRRVSRPGGLAEWTDSVVLAALSGQAALVSLRRQEGK